VSNQARPRITAAAIALAFACGLLGIGIAAVRERGLPRLVLHGLAAVGEHCGHWLAGGGSWCSWMACALATGLLLITWRAPRTRSPGLRAAALLASTLATGASLALASSIPGWIWGVANAVALATLVPVTRREGGIRTEAVVRSTGAWLSLGAAVAALAAILMLTGVQRETGSFLHSEWQCWDCLVLGEDLRSLLQITPGTARFSLDSGPYRMLVRGTFALFGPSWGAMRLLSAGCLLIAAGLLFGFLRTRLSLPSAIAGTAMFTTSPHLLDLGHVPSFLGLSVLLSVVSLTLFVRWIEAPSLPRGIVLGIALFADLYGYGPLRFFVAVLPVGMVLAWLQAPERPLLHRWPIVVPALLLGVLTMFAFGVTTSRLKELGRADGEFLATVVRNGDHRVDLGHTLRKTSASMSSIVANTLDANDEFRLSADGRHAPFLPTHRLILLLGVVALAVGSSWKGKTGRYLAVLLGCQVVMLLLMDAPVWRRMTVYVPLLVLIAAGGVELLLGTVVSYYGDPRAARRAAVVVVVLAILPLFPAAVHSYPGVAERPAAETLAERSCDHLRDIADAARERGYALVALDRGRFSTEGIDAETCQSNVVRGNWNFYRWLDCAFPSGPAPGLIEGLGGAQAGPAGHATGWGDEQVVSRLGWRERLTGLNVRDVGPAAPVFWIGGAQIVLFVDPATDEGAAWLTELDAAGAQLLCEAETADWYGGGGCMCAHLRCEGCEDY